MNTFPGWRSVGHAMRWARQQDGIEISELKSAGRLFYRSWSRPGEDRGVTVHPNPNRPIAEVRAGCGVLDFTASDAYAEVPDALTVLRVLAALDLIPDKQYGRCEVCDETCRWDDGAATWEHVKPLLVWGDHGPHPAEVAE